MAPTKTWRDVEKWYATRLGAERVHSGDKRDERDVRSKFLSVEVKHRIEAIPASVKRYIAQIKKNARKGTIGFVIAHEPGTRRESAVVYIEFREFEKLLRAAGYAPQEGTENEV